jgi:hypothetical protein
MLEDLLAERERNKRPKGGRGNVAQEGQGRGKRNRRNMEGWKISEERYGRTLLLFLGDVGIGKGKREKIDWSSCNGRAREKRRGWSGKSVRHDIFGTRKVGKSGSELRKEGKVTLLPGGKWSASFGNGSD